MKSRKKNAFGGMECDLPRQKEGGLGLKNLYHMNLVHLSILAWRMLVSPHLLWAIVLWKKYESPFNVKTWNSNIFHIWITRKAFTVQKWYRALHSLR